MSPRFSGPSQPNDPREAGKSVHSADRPGAPSGQQGTKEGALVPPRAQANPEMLDAFLPPPPMPLGQQEALANVEAIPSLSDFRQELPSPMRPFPIQVSSRLLAAFRSLKVEPVLSGGSAVQVWTGRSDDIFETHDLDFITSLTARDLEPYGILRTSSGRHVLADDQLVEFPSGTLGVGDLDLDPIRDTLLVPTRVAGELVRCLRPEACVLDRLALVANDRTSSAFLQACAVVLAQSEDQAWDQDWIDRHAPKARLGLLWEFLKAEITHPSSEGLDEALTIGWDPLPAKDAP